MKTKKTILSLAISALLTAGAASYPMSSYADNKDDGGTKTKVEVKKADSSTGKAQAASNSDSDTRGNSDKSSQKITICHVPPGNPAQKHTIHIAFSAWAAHKLHTNTKGPDYADYLGSCNSRTATTAKESLHVISGCTGSTREALETKVQSYYNPITVADSSLDDDSVVTAMSQCLDKGDSSDSSKSGGDSSKSASGGKGGGHDSVSDSGQHHRIRGCQNKDTSHKADSNDPTKHGLSDSDKKDGNTNYHKTLKDADSGHDTAKGIKDPVVVSDSNLDDSGVWKEYKTCAAKDGNGNRIDSSKTGKKKGDSGHGQHILKSCGDTQDQKLKDAIVAHKAKTSTKDIILTAAIYNDASIKALIDSCVSAGAKDSVTDSFSSNVAIPNVAITNATITNATIINGVITGGTITAGTGDIANVVGGAISSGTASGGTTTGGSTTGGTTTGATITGATITGANVYTGESGRLYFRENLSPRQN